MTTVFAWRSQSGARAVGPDGLFRKPHLGGEQLIEMLCPMPVEFSRRVEPVGSRPISLGYSWN